MQQTFIVFIQDIGNSTIEVVANQVANITSNAELMAADISSTTAVLERLTAAAVTNPEVGYIELYNTIAC